MIAAASFLGTLLSLGACGTVALRTLEGTAPRLSALERVSAGFLLGTVGGMIVLWWLLLAGMPLSRAGVLGFLAATGVCTVVLASRLRRAAWHTQIGTEHGALSRRMRIVAWVLGIATALKLAVLGVTFTLVPSYLDDTVSNWNMRAKIFFEERTFTATMPEGMNQQLGSYPPAVSLLKAAMAAVNGAWSEPLANGAHVLWYLALLGLLFGMLRRWLPLSWSLLGLYAYASLPLPLLHGTNAYADTFLSAHVLAAVGFLLAALHAEEEDRRALLLCSAAMGALLPFTKNEGLLLYGSTYALLFAFALRRLLPGRKTIALALSFAAAVLVPLLLFKWTHGLTFGNAKPVSGVGLTFEPVVLRVMAVHLFFEGNWHLLFYAFVALVALEWRTALTPPLRTVTAYIVLALGMQMFLYLGTSLSVEALKQTGFGRGVLHIVPLIVFLTAVLAYQRFSKRR